MFSITIRGQEGCKGEPSGILLVIMILADKGKGGGWPKDRLIIQGGALRQKN